MLVQLTALLVSTNVPETTSKGRGTTHREPEQGIHLSYNVVKGASMNISTQVIYEGSTTSKQMLPAGLEPATN